MATVTLMSSIISTSYAGAHTISFFPTKDSALLNSSTNNTKIIKIVERHFSINQYRDIKVQVIYNQKKLPDHILVYLFSKKYHRFNVARIDIDSHYNEISTQQNYTLSAEDNAKQPGISAKEAVCPDSSVEFIAFAPNDDDLEQQVTVDVANAAEAHPLKTIRLLKKDATRSNYLNYMKCPNLKGNFYDGDSNPNIFITVDGSISAEDMDNNLQGAFRYKVTNIWLACEAYNDPLKTSLLTTEQSQKYAAGISDLLIGPSDKSAACAMKKAIAGQAMTAAFWDCYNKLDDKSDIWGLGGNGSDYFGM